MSVTFDDRDFQKKAALLLQKIKEAQKKAVQDVAGEVLRLSTFEVPFRTGLLQASGHVELQAEEAIVGYNKVYAARLHEHPEYRFNNGRKGKYLEDPIKRNLFIFRTFIEKAVNGVLR